MSFDFEVRKRGCPQNEANFGIGTLARCWSMVFSETPVCTPDQVRGRLFRDNALPSRNKPTGEIFSPWVTRSKTDGLGRVWGRGRLLRGILADAYAGVEMPRQSIPLWIGEAPERYMRARIELDRVC